MRRTNQKGVYRDWLVLGIQPHILASHPLALLFVFGGQFSSRDSTITETDYRVVYTSGRLSSTRVVPDAQAERTGQQKQVQVTERRREVRSCLSLFIANGLAISSELKSYDY